MWHPHFGITMLCASEANDRFRLLPFSNDRYSTFVSVYDITLSHLCFGSIWYHSIHGARCQIIFESQKIILWMNSTSLNICGLRGAAFRWAGLQTSMSFSLLKSWAAHLSATFCVINSWHLWKILLKNTYSKNSPLWVRFSHLAKANLFSFFCFQLVTKVSYKIKISW